MFIISLFWALSGFFKAISDNIAHRDGFRYWGNWWTKDSWMNKWKNGNPKEGERFPGSSTVFVWVTDAWHFANTLQMTMYLFAVSAASNIHVPTSIPGVLFLLSLPFARAITFHVFYHFTFSKTNKYH